jgi:hypothetical protein
LARKDAASAEPLLRQALQVRQRAFPEVSDLAAFLRVQ